MKVEMTILLVIYMCIARGLERGSEKGLERGLFQVTSMSTSTSSAKHRDFPAAFLLERTVSGVYIFPKQTFSGRTFFVADLFQSRLLPGGLFPERTLGGIFPERSVSGADFFQSGPFPGRIILANFCQDGLFPE